MPIQRTLQVNLLDLPVVQETITRKPDDTLYHYTKRAGLLGILGSKDLWASNARYMNDAMELATAISLARSLIGRIELNSQSEDDKLAVDMVRLLETIDEMRDVFVFSFSTNGDLLSQWRAYTTPGNAYAIGFEPAQIAAIADRATFHLAPCEYRLNEQRRLVELVLADARAELRKGLEAKKKPLDARGDALIRFAGGFFFIAPMIKDAAFAEEEEWRLIHPAASVWQPEVRFRDGVRMTVPYIPIAVGDGPVPITTVIVGPTPHPELERRALSGLLTQCGLGTAKVEPSRVPYRLW